MIESLNGDLSREYQAIIAYVIYSQMLRGAQYMAIAKELEAHAKQELDHAITIAKQIDYLGGTPTAEPKAVRISSRAEEMLRFDLDNETETIRNYRERVRQCEALNEFAMAEEMEILRVEQEHQIDPPRPLAATCLLNEALDRFRRDVAPLSNHKGTRNKAVVPKGNNGLRVFSVLCGSRKTRFCARTGMTHRGGRRIRRRRQSGSCKPHTLTVQPQFAPRHRSPHSERSACGPRGVGHAHPHDRWTITVRTAPSPSPRSAALDPLIARDPA